MRPRHRRHTSSLTILLLVVSPGCRLSRSLGELLTRSWFKGRAQAAPITAWLRVPLDFYASTISAQFPDETPTSIRRTFYAPSSQPALPPTRRQFCGYCGTLITAWNEALHAGGFGNNRGSDYIDVSLGSLLDESLDKLESLGILPDDSDEDSVQGVADELRRGASVQEDITRNEDGSIPVAVRKSSQAAQAPHRMQNRGMPYFEEMIEHSRLGRIRRQVGGHTSQDGTSTVQWEVVEIGGDEPSSGAGVGTGGNKRQKLDI